MASELRIGALLRQSYQEVAKSINRRLEEAGYHDIRSTHFPVLQPLLFHPTGMTSSELANLAGITKQSMGEIVKYLEERGYVEKTISATDARARRVVLSPKGAELMNQVYEIVTALDGELANRFGERNFQTLRSLLQEFLPMVQAMNDG